MNRAALFLSSLLSAGVLAAQTSLAPMALPAPQKAGGKPLMEALALRATSRAFDPKDLTAQQLSDLLWAAFGINRPDGKRTAPSARNTQEIHLYVLLKQGTFRYQAQSHRLDPVAPADLRAFGGLQPFVKDAPVTLILVADLAKTGTGPLAQRREWSHLNAGYISQNIYLYCASMGLATGARAYVDKALLAPKLILRPDQEILLGQSVGWPAAH
jgi:SagB-type dehydrogenase family enzyme